MAAGYEFDYFKERRQSGNASAGEKTPRSLTRNEDNVAQNSDFFLQATTVATVSMSVVTGLRSTNVRFSSSDLFLNYGNGSGSVRYNAINPVLGLTLHASDTLNLYANYGKGLKTPTLAEVAYTSSGPNTTKRSSTLV